MSRRPVAALLAAYGTSLVGTRLSMIAVPLFVLETTGSATRTGLVAMAEMGPYVICQALAGPVTDRVGPRRMSILSDVVSVGFVGLIPVLHAAGALHFGTLLALVGLAGAVRGPGDSAKYVLAPVVAVVSAQPVERVLGLTDGINRAASVIGPLAAAALVTAVGPATAIGLDAASFAVSALVVAAGLRRHETVIGRRARTRTTPPPTCSACARGRASSGTTACSARSSRWSASPTCSTPPTPAC